jgi:site-specific recombinase XerD
MGTKASTRKSVAVDLGTLIPSFGRHLRASNAAPRTIQSYLEACDQFLAFLVERGMPTAPAKITREHIETSLEDVLAKWKPTTALSRFKSLQQLFKWLLDEGEIQHSPMERMRPPTRA